MRELVMHSGKSRLLHILNHYSHSSYYWLLSAINWVLSHFMVLD